MCFLLAGSIVPLINIRSPIRLPARDVSTLQESISVTPLPFLQGVSSLVNGPRLGKLYVGSAARVALTSF